MQWTETKRRVSILAGMSALALATACGGGDKSPTGPGGGNGGTDFDLVALGFAGLPADAQPEDCSMTRFYGGGLHLNQDGTWKIRLQVHNGDGDWGYEDEGQAEQDGTTVWFDSGISGSSYQGTVDGGAIRIMYDWCYNGVPDVQLVFQQ